MKLNKAQGHGVIDSQRLMSSNDALAPERGTIRFVSTFAVPSVWACGYISMLGGYPPTRVYLRYANCRSQWLCLIDLVLNSSGSFFHAASRANQGSLNSPPRTRGGSATSRMLGGGDFRATVSGHRSRACTDRALGSRSLNRPARIRLGQPYALSEQPLFSVSTVPR